MLKRLYLALLTCTLLAVPAEATFRFGPTQIPSLGLELEDFSVSEEDALYIAQTIYGEAGSDYISTAEKAMVAWTVLNRLDDGYGGATNVYEVVSASGQFYGFLAGTTPPENLLEIARDVLRRHEAEWAGYTGVGRVLPPGYYYFYGDGAHNYFYGEGGGSYDFSGLGYLSPY